MSIENPEWRLEIWHEGLKAADIRNDEFDLVVADLVQFEATRRELAEAEAEAETFTESPATYWAHFAAAALQRKHITPEIAAAMADQLLAEYGKRFSEEA
jgi:hypothetical protein